MGWWNGELAGLVESLWVGGVVKVVKGQLTTASKDTPRPRARVLPFIWLPRDASAYLGGGGEWWWVVVDCGGSGTRVTITRVVVVVVVVILMPMVLTMAVVVVVVVAVVLLLLMMLTMVMVATVVAAAVAVVVNVLNHVSTRFEQPNIYIALHEGRLKLLHHQQ